MNALSIEEPVENGSIFSKLDIQVPPRILVPLYLKSTRWSNCQFRLTSVATDQFPKFEKPLLRSIMPLRSLQALSDRLGLSAFEMISADSSLSVDQERPTRFYYSNAITFPAGERLLDIRTWQEVVLERNVRCEVEANADGSLTDRTFAGLFRSRTNYIDLDLAVTLEGRFTIHLT